MSIVARPVHITGTGNVGGDSGGEIELVVLTPAAAVSTLTLKEGGSGGATILILQAAANGGSVVVEVCSLAYSGQLHATLSGTGATATIGL